MWLRQRQRRSRPTARACPRDGSPPVDFRMYSLLFVGVLATALSSQPGSGVSTWRSRMQAAANAYERGRYLRAEELFKKALDRAKDFGPEDERLPLNLNNLAEVYRAQGRYTEAESLYRQSVAIWMIFGGADIPYVAISLNNLALVSASQGMYDKAERLYRKSLAVWRNIGGNSLGVAKTLENYSSLLREVGRDAEASELEQRARSIWAETNRRGP